MHVMIISVLSSTQFLLWSYNQKLVGIVFFRSWTDIPEIIQLCTRNTLSDTNIAPKNDGLENELPFGAQCISRDYVSFREGYPPLCIRTPHTPHLVTRSSTKITGHGIFHQGGYTRNSLHEALQNVGIWRLEKDIESYRETNHQNISVAQKKKHIARFPWCQDWKIEERGACKSASASLSKRFLHRNWINAL